MTEVMRESKQAPESVERAVTRAGGLNRYGEPNFRWCGDGRGWHGSEGSGGTPMRRENWCAK